MQTKRIAGSIFGLMVGGMMTVAFFLLFGPVLPVMVDAFLGWGKLSPGGAAGTMIASVISFVIIFLPGAIMGGIYGWHGFVIEEEQSPRKAGRVL